MTPLSGTAEVVPVVNRGDPCGETPYAVQGRLVGLGRAGVRPAEFTLPQPEAWTRQEFRERKALIGDLAERIEEMGLPADHPWRGVGLDAILPTDVVRFTERQGELAPRIESLIDAVGEVRRGLGCDDFEDSGEGIALLVNAALGVAAAPAFIDAEALTSAAWTDRRSAVADLVATGQALAESRARLDGVVVEAAWTSEMAAARQGLAAHGESWLRLLNGAYRRASATLRGFLCAAPPKSLSERLDIVDTLIAGQKADKAIAEDEALGAEAFGTLWRRDRSEWAKLAAVEGWDRDCHDQPLPKDFRAMLGRAGEREEVGRRAADVGTRLESLLADCGGLFADLKLDIEEAFASQAVRAVPLAGLAERFRTWSARGADLAQWIAYRTRAEATIGRGLAAVVERLYDGRLSADEAAEVFELAYFEALMRVIFEQHPELASFDGPGHQSLVEEFRKLDQQRIALGRAEVVLAHYRGMPRGGGEIGQVGILEREFAKKRRHLPIRTLMKAAGQAIQAIKPVFMMSPLSVAQFLEPGALRFGLLLIDEASQVQPVDALGAVARVGQIVVVGDDKQLPPTRFFTKMLAAGDDDEDAALLSAGDLESVLGLCTAQGVPQRMLRWHYRSRHPSLIAVSNHEFYDDRLFIVPSPYGVHPGLGLSFHHLPEGVFDSGGSGTNRVEAAAVARAVIDHARSDPDLSLGVGCFSVRQRDAILDELEHLWRAEPDVQEFFAPGAVEPFFVKNLENIQGDERDVIFISVGYARNESGYMAMRFGPVGAEGGERRLNVLISRARLRCEVFSSITADDIDLERGRGQGVAALKAFLGYAQHATFGVTREARDGFDSPFEEEVARALTGLGYEVDSQVGTAGFFVDLAVVDADRRGRYVIGIECDGAAYHSARSARDRDRLRQQVLEDHGWIIHRIWSTDWFQRPENQLRKTVAAIDAAKAEWARRDQDLLDRSRPDDAPAPADGVDREQQVPAADDGDEAARGVAGVPYREARLTVPKEQEPHLIGPEKMADVVIEIVGTEGPVHAAEIACRVSDLWGLRRTGSRIVGAVDKGIGGALQRGAIVGAGEFYGPTGKDAPEIRDRSEVPSAGLRKPEMLPPAEIRAAVSALVEANFGAGRDEIASQVGRLLGFKSTGSQLRQVIEAEIDALVEDGALVDRDGTIQKSERAS